MKIQDMDENQFIITLWGHEAENFDEDAVRTISAQGSVTILFVSMATDKFRDKLSLKFTNLARYYIDADVPISSALKRKYRNEPNQVQWHQMDNTRAEATETTLLDLSKQDKGAIEGRFFKVAIEITDIDARAWWFWACDSCVKLTKPNGNIFTCTGMQCTCIKGSRRYIINAYARDANSVAEGEDVMGSFAFFGKQGTRLTGQDEDVVYASTEERTDGLPPAVANVIGKKYLVTGRVTQEIYAGDVIPFRVAATEVIASPVQLPPRAPAVEQALVSEGTPTSPQSPPIESGKSSGSVATPPREVIEEYGSDVGEDISSNSDKRKRKSKNVPPGSTKKQANKNLFAKK